MRLIPIAGFTGSGKSLAALRLALQLHADGQNVCVCLERENPITAALFGEYQVKVFHQPPQELQDFDAVIYECDGLRADLKGSLAQLPDVSLAPLTVVVDPAKLHTLAAYGAALLGNPGYSEVVNAQLKQADVVLLSHLDLQQPSQAVQSMVAAQAPEAVCVPFSAKLGDGTQQWVEALQGEAAPAEPVNQPDVSMTRYDCSLHIAAPIGFFPDRFLNALANKVRTALSALPVPLAAFQVCTVSEEGVAIYGCTDTSGIIREDRLVNLCSVGAELFIQMGANCDREYLCDIMYDAIQHTCTSMERGMTVVGEFPSIWDDEE